MSQRLAWVWLALLQAVEVTAAILARLAPAEEVKALTLVHPGAAVLDCLLLTDLVL